MSRKRRSNGTINNPEPKPVSPLMKKAANTTMLDRIIVCRDRILLLLSLYDLSGISL